MGGVLRIRVADERTPLPVEGIETDDEEWTLSLDAHSDLLIDIAGVEPTDELTLQELETIRARLEGYVEREKRASTETAESTSRRESTRGPDLPDTPLRRLLARLLDLVPLGWTRTRSPVTSERRAGARRSYSVARVQRLAHVFRVAIDDRQAEISAASVDPATGATTATASSADAVAD